MSDDFQQQVLNELRNINSRLDTELGQINERLDRELGRLDAEMSRVNTRLDRLEGDVRELKSELRELRVEFNAYQKGLDGMVRMANTIIIATASVIVLGNLVPSVLNFVGQTANLTTR
ncbi:MAG: hypothetical protein NZL92_11180 [Gloeomargarita sp. SKYG116]|nr:hypothetical protein [Gloeomargarita sp. SKYG116]MCS7227119.1 hypothetical protein [Gloeomargarita sp. SKYB31]MDW8402245.1 hypothetical protein [Gloeomargarita sp. SKYGB_i_bin116]